MAHRNANSDAMMQLLQTLMADRETDRAERQASLAALQQLANNQQGHGHHDHPGSKLKNFQNTNPPVFSKTEEPLDADDWLQTMENNLEVAGVDENEKVLFATHYLAGPARAWWTSARALNAGQMMTWADFKLKFSKYHVPPGLIKKMRDEFRELKQGRMSVVEYRDRFLTLSRYAPDETDTNEKRKERFLNGLHDEMQTVLVNIPFADLEALVDSSIQMEGKLHQANENRKRRMMNQSGPSNAPRYRPSSSSGFAPRNNKPQNQVSRPGFQNRSGGNPRPGGPHHNSNNPNSYVHHNSNFNRAPPRAPNTNNNNTNTAPRTGSNAIPVGTKDKSTITCYECGVVGHFSNECPKRLAKLAGNTAAPAQQQRRVSTGKKFAPNNPHNRGGRLYHMNAEEAQEAPDVVLGLNFSSRNLLDSAAGGTFMSITLGAATKLLDDMMINYSEWHTERAPQGKKVNFVEETSSLSDKIDVIMSMLVNGRSNVDPNNVPLASLVAQEENVDVNFIKNNNFNNNAYRNNSEILVKKYSRNWTKLSPGSYFCTKLPEDRRDNEVGPRGSQRLGGAAQARRATRWAPRVAPALTFRLLKASVAKPRYREPRYGKPYRDAAAANPISGDSEIASGTLPERGFISGGLFIAMIASGVMSE
ncbi:hypothetical protein QYE76_030996 [Lolium multiflorum]|uniref:CCHC-type domain-containing protein n=1 Tax=Lolium multiflorum TaxID=4521 RepID=A0AAD8VJV6_LOLMU|nr:hypothetical protein QYE76_030996 [Lolium multiflorum]